MRVKLIKDWTRKGKTVKAGTDIIISADALTKFQAEGLVAGGKKQAPPAEPEKEQTPKRTSIWGKAN